MKFIIYFAPATGERKYLYEKYGSMQTRDNFTNLEFCKIWAFDNGAFADYKKNKEFNSEKFLWRMKQINDLTKAPEFIVVPDIVGKGIESLKFSLMWHKKLEFQYPKFKYYFVIQNGMIYKDIEPIINNFNGLFVGGTVKWKMQNLEYWINFAKKNKKPIHIGRIGSVSKILHCKFLGANSVDSGLALIHPHHLQKILDIEKYENSNLFKKGYY